jgi:hypothetical protein
MSAPPPRQLVAEDERAVEAIASATRTDLEAALVTLPSYQRLAVRWLARELALRQEPRLPPKPAAETLAGLERMHARRAAALAHDGLSHAIRCSAATAEQKAFMAQHLAHLWQSLMQAIGETC